MSSARGSLAGEIVRHAVIGVARGVRFDRRRGGGHRAQAGDRNRERCDGDGDGQGLRSVAQQPAGAALHQPAAREIHLGLHVDVDHGIERLDLAPQCVLVEERARGFVGAHDIRRRRARFLADPEHERHPGPVDEPVHERGRRHLPSQRVCADAIEEAGAHGRGERADELGQEVGVVGERAVEELFLERDLGVREQHCELRNRQPDTRAVPFGQHLVVGQSLDPPIEVAARLERADEARVYLVHHLRLRPRVVERAVLPVVVTQYERGDVVGHANEQRIAVVLGDLARVDGAVEQDLEVHLVVRRVDAGAVVDRVGVDTPARDRVLDAPVLREAEVATFADGTCPQVAPVDAHRVVRLVSDLGVRLGVRLHVGADAAVVEQVDGCAQDCMDHLRRRQGLDGVGDPESRSHLGGHRNGLQRAREHTPAHGDECGVVVGPRRARELEQALAFRERGRGVGLGVEEHMAVVERGNQPDVFREQHPVAEHVAGHVADADDGEVVAIGVHAEVAEVPLHRLPRAAGGDAHCLVVVAVLAAGREGVAEPEAAAARDLVGDV
jgi:hypothetical protein